MFEWNGAAAAEVLKIVRFCNMRKRITLASRKV